MRKSIKKETIITLIVTFILFFVFFYIVRPLGIYDSDDWGYVSYVRSIFPDFRAWNPTRILPETWLSLLGTIASYMIYPVLGDYIQSITLCLAIFSALFICVLGYFLMELMVRVLGAERRDSITFWFLFLIASMLIFGKGNLQHLFWAENVTCFFYYIIPSILNAITVMFFAIRWKDNAFKIDAITVFLVYFSINSNMYCSILLVACLSAFSFVEIIDELKNKKTDNKFIKMLFKEHLFTVVVDVIWLMSLLMELNGGRARMLGSEGNGFQLVETIQSFIMCILMMNRCWVVVNMLLIVVMCIICLKDKDSNQTKLFISLLLSLIITTVYVVLLCAKVSPDYVSQSKTLFTVLFLVELISLYSLINIVRLFPIVKMVTPVIILSLVFVINHNLPEYNHYNVNQLNYNQAKKVDDDIIEQYIAADESGSDTATIYIPKHASEEWPISIYYGPYNTSQALYRHGIISRQFDVTFVQSVEKNRELGVE